MIDKKWFILCGVSYCIAFVIFWIVGFLSIYINDMFVLLTPIVLIPICFPFVGAHKIGE